MGKVSKFFTITMNIVQCNLCSYNTTKSKSSSTFKLIQHIKNNHPYEHALVDKANGSSFSGIHQSQPSTSMLNTSDTTGDCEEADNIRKALANMISMDIPEFSQLLSVPKYNVESCWEMPEAEIPQVYVDLRSKLQKELDSAEFVTVGFVKWNDQETHSEIIGIIAHFLKKTEVVQRFLGAIDCKNIDGTTEIILENIKKELEEYKISEKVVAVVRDDTESATNEVKFTKAPSICCLTHKLNLAVEEGINTIAGLSNLLEKVQIALNLLFSRDPVPAVQWKHIKLTLEQALNSKYSIVELQKDDESSLNASEWSLIETIVDLLTSFFDVAGKAQTGKNNASSIIPMFTFLRNQLENNLGHLEARSVMAFRIERALQEYRDCEYLTYSTVFDPRYKDLFFEGSANEMLMDLIIADWEKLKNSASDETRTIGEPAKKRQKMSQNFDDFMKGKIKSHVELKLEASKKAALKVEITRYLETPPDLLMDPFKYWMNKETKKSYPLLSKAASKYFICPSSSPEVGNFFSTAGIMLNEHRRNSSPEIFKMMIFNSENISLLESGTMWSREN